MAAQVALIIIRAVAEVALVQLVKMLVVAVQVALD
jgi:hypothetical protein